LGCWHVTCLALMQLGPGLDVACFVCRKIIVCPPLTLCSSNHTSFTIGRNRLSLNTLSLKLAPLYERDLADNFSVLPRTSCRRDHPPTAQTPSCPRLPYQNFLDFSKSLENSKKFPDYREYSKYCEHLINLLNLWH
jgi:hypothetical protein